MSGPIRLFVGSYPEFYDRLLVPVLFAPYARILAERLRGMTVGNVLEIAAGTGVVTRALVHTLPEAVNITATDLNPPMLDRARSHAGMDRVHWQQANALALPFGEHEFDCAICQFGVMFFADKRAAFRETFRVLKARRPVPVHCLGSRRGGRHPIRRSRGHRAPAVARPGIAASAALFRPYRRARRPRGGRLWRRVHREIA